MEKTIRGVKTVFQNLPLEIYLVSTCSLYLALRISSHSSAHWYIRPCFVLGTNTGSSLLSACRSRKYAKSSVVLRDEDYRRGSLRSHGFDNIHDEHPIELLDSKLSHHRTSTMKTRVDGSAVFLVKLNSVLHCFNWPEVAIPPAFELLEHFCTFVAKLGVVIGIKRSFRHSVCKVS